MDSFGLGVYHFGLPLLRGKGILGSGEIAAMSPTMCDCRRIERTGRSMGMGMADAQSERTAQGYGAVLYFAYYCGTPPYLVAGPNPDHCCCGLFF
jgi:hypothetical protein